MGKVTNHPELGRYYKILFPEDTNIPGLSDEFTRNSFVEFAVPNYIAEITVEPNDPFFPSQWAFNDSSNAKLHFPTAWDITTGDASVVAAVLDTGFAVSHPDLDSKNTQTGYNFFDNNSDVQDGQGHGTSVSGIIAAETNNNEGVAGASWGTRIMPIKVCGPDPSDPTKTICPIDAVWNGIILAANNGADIINMSLGE